MRFFFFLIGLFLLVPPARAETTPSSSTPLNAGFVNVVWYSSAQFFVNDTVRVYSTIQNQSGYDLVGKIELIDGDEVIGQTDISIVNGALIQKWIDWKVTKGPHDLYEKIIDAKRSEAGKNPESVTLQFPTTARETKTGEVRVIETPPITKTIPAPTTEKISVENPPATTAEKNNSSTTTHTAVSTTTSLSTSTQEFLTNVATTTKKIITFLTAPVVAHLEQQKTLLDEEIKKDPNPTPVPLLEAPAQEIEKRAPYFKIPRDKLPTNKQVYSWLLSLAIYLARTWWFVLIIFILLLRAGWKVISLLRRPREE